MHITNKKLGFGIFTVGISSWDMILISNDFCHKRKMYNFDPYNVLLAITTNIPVLLMTASVLQGHNINIITIKSVNKPQEDLCLHPQSRMTCTHTCNISLNTHDEVSNINSYHTRTASET